MPEGDTIHRQASELGAQLVGRAVTQLYARGVTYGALRGESITSVEARGKHLLIGIGDRAHVHVHLGMSGRVTVVPIAKLSLREAARASLVVATDDVAAIWSHAHTVEVLRAAFTHLHLGLSALGPDLLDDTFDAPAVLPRARARPTTTTLGELLLDQGVAAGIGNVYKSEVLFLEKLDPWTKVGSVDDETLVRVYTRARELMLANVKPGIGSGSGPWQRTTTANLAQGEWIPRGHGRMYVYRRVGRPCHVCGTPIASATQGEQVRRTYYCPRCQPRQTPAAPPESPESDDPTVPPGTTPTSTP